MTVKPPPQREKDLNSPIWQKWFKDVVDTANDAAPKVDSPTVDNFASLDADGNIQDSGYDATSFAGASHTQALSTITDYTDYKETGIALLASVTINGQTLTKQTVYTVPAGKTMIPHLLYVRSPSATLLGLTDMDIGGDAAAGDWLQQITLNAFTATTDYGVIMQPAQAAGPPIVPEKKTLYAAATVFGVKIITGSTGVATFKIDLFGYLF